MRISEHFSTFPKSRHMPLFFDFWKNVRKVLDEAHHYNRFQQTWRFVFILYHSSSYQPSFFEIVRKKQARALPDSSDQEIPGAPQKYNMRMINTALRVFSRLPWHNDHPLLSDHSKIHAVNTENRSLCYMLRNRFLYTFILRIFSLMRSETTARTTANTKTRMNIQIVPYLLSAATYSASISAAARCRKAALDR